MGQASTKISRPLILKDEVGDPALETHHLLQKKETKLHMGPTQPGHPSAAGPDPDEQPTSLQNHITTRSKKSIDNPELVLISLRAFHNINQFSRLNTAI
jgi:hypothetical protein